MKKLIINCDDLGISEETNLGVIDCLTNKKATSASIVSNGTFFNHAIKNIKEKIPKHFFGIHLNLTEGRALNNDSLNFLADEKMNFNNKPSSFFIMNLKRNKTIDNLIYLEFKAQIIKVLEQGINISHFDSHEHIHHSPFIYQILKKLGNEFGIKKIRLVNEAFFTNIFFKNFGYKFFSKNYIKYFLLNFCAKMNQDKFFKCPDYFFGILNSGNINMNEFFLYIKKIKDNSVVELCIHPANKFLGSENYKNDFFYKDFTFNENRFIEKELLFSNLFKKKLDDHKIKLINFTDLN
tara:strand:+ start:56 stop:937 length:882 start_codon:yes stop_codon:yes gene_type:complete